MAKSARDKIRMVSSEGTGHFYTTDKNKKNTPGKMEMKKYDVNQIKKKQKKYVLVIMIN